MEFSQERFRSGLVQLQTINIRQICTGRDLIPSYYRSEFTVQSSSLKYSLAKPTNQQHGVLSLGHQVLIQTWEDIAKV